MDRIRDRADRIIWTLVRNHVSWLVCPAGNSVVFRLSLSNKVEKFQHTLDGGHESLDNSSATEMTTEPKFEQSAGSIDAIVKSEVNKFDFDLIDVLDEPPLPNTDAWRLTVKRFMQRDQYSWYRLRLCRTGFFRLKKKLPLPPGFDQMKP